MKTEQEAVLGVMSCGIRLVKTQNCAPPHVTKVNQDVCVWDGEVAQRM